MTLTVAAVEDADRTRIRLTGSIDRNAGPQLDAIRIAAEGPPVLELDFAAVDYINSSGLALLVGLLVRARAAGTAVHALHLAAHYRHIFEITRLSDFLTIVEPNEGGDRGHS